MEEVSDLVDSAVGQRDALQDPAAQATDVLIHLAFQEELGRGKEDAATSSSSAAPPAPRLALDPQWRRVCAVWASGVAGLLDALGTVSTEPFRQADNRTLSLVIASNVGG